MHNLREEYSTAEPAQLPALRGQSRSRPGGKMFLALIISIILFVPSWCQAEFYLGGYIGGNFTSNVNPGFWGYSGYGPPIKSDGSIAQYIYAVRNAQNVSVSPAFLAGGKVGYWFDKVPIIGYELPSFLKYFGFEINIGYHNLAWPGQQVSVTPINRSYDLQMNGNVVPICFMFMGRYGFMPDEVAPWGRLQPYAGIGPAVFITSQHLNIGADYRSTEGDLGLAVEAGIRYFLTKKISINTALQYRRAKIHLDVDDKIFDLPQLNIPMYTNYNFFSFVVGVEYHFF